LLYLRVAFTQILLATLVIGRFSVVRAYLIPCIWCTNTFRICCHKTKSLVFEKLQLILESQCSRLG